MMKHEFDNLVGLTTAPECYERIEYVYTHCPLFSETNGKREIANFYMAHDMNGIERLYRALKDIFAAMKEGVSYGDPWSVIHGYAEELFAPPADGEKSATWDKWLEHSRAWQKEYSYESKTLALSPEAKNTAEEGTTRLSVLREMQDMAWHNLFCYSANYGMTKPKAGAEERWAEAKAKADIVDQMLTEEKMAAQAASPAPHKAHGTTNAEAYVADLAEIDAAIQKLLLAIPTGQTKKAQEARAAAEEIASFARASIACMKNDYIPLEL